MTYNIQVLNNISSRGLEKFDSKQYKLSPECHNPDAILLRSFDLHHVEIADSVQVVGRAGVGTNNIPIAELTKRGIPVLNTPGANANAVKELVITGMLLASRHIYPALNYAGSIEGDDEALHQQVEKNKKRFAGFELPGKTLGVIGLGKIGVKVANAAVNLGMKVIGFDPAMTVKNAWQLSADVQQAEAINDVLNSSDFISLHVPLNDHTRNMINKDTIAAMKAGVVLLNFARADIVDNPALSQALATEQVRHYVSDFPSNTFKNNPQVIALPHLGASTKEAEENCAMMIADQVQAFLTHGHIIHSVNFPEVKLPFIEGHRLTVANANVPNMVAQISTVLSQANINIADMISKSRADIAYTVVDVNANITDELLTKIRAIDGVIRAHVLAKR